MPLISVITPSCRGTKQISQLIRDFRNQLFRDFEHLIIYDGMPPKDVTDFMTSQSDQRIRFTHIEKDFGDMRIAPGTRPRNHGVKIAKGQYVVFCDDDDRYRDSFLATLVSGMNENTLSVVQMSCQESRMYKNGSPNRIILIPEVGLDRFPVCCHVGTPCVMMPRKWVLETPWQHEPEHDYRLFSRIVQKYNPQIRITPSMQIDVDGLVLAGMKDWVSIPPFYRD